MMIDNTEDNFAMNDFRRIFDRSQLPTLAQDVNVLCWVENQAVQILRGPASGEASSSGRSRISLQIRFDCDTRYSL